MSVQAYINFNGNCKEAVEYYVDVFKTNKPKFMLFGDIKDTSGFGQDEAVKNLVMHTFLMISGSKVMFSDVPPGMPFIQGNNISLTVVSKEESELRSVYQKLIDGGTINMELQDTFSLKSFSRKASECTAEM